MSTPALILLAGIAGIFHKQTQNIRGVVNAYTKVTAVVENTVTVENSVAFGIGDKVLLIQMKGATISRANDSTFGNITSWGSAGNYEFADVKFVSGKQVYLKHPICRKYDPAYAVQLVLVPTFEHVKLDGKVFALPWDGEKGGVVAIWAEGEIWLENNIDVSGLGFRGGGYENVASDGGTVYSCLATSGHGSQKGEGIAHIPENACRGKLANGGGGGNNLNAGGGGGGHYAKGGNGGFGWKSNQEGAYSDSLKAGIGGMSIAKGYADGVSRLFMGGGGGGGHQDDGTVYRGGNGGGIVMLVGGSLKIGKGVRITANGEDAMDVYTADGASGGGAGGAIMLDIGSLKVKGKSEKAEIQMDRSKLTLSVAGGNGGNVHTHTHHGPGGGGSGGIICANSAIPALASVQLEGGQAGIFSSTKGKIHALHKSYHGSEDGAPGAVLQNLILQKSSLPPRLYTDKQNKQEIQTNFYPSYGQPSYVGRAGSFWLEDLDDSSMESAIIELLNPIDGGVEALRLDMSQAELAKLSLHATFDTANHRIILRGNSPIINYLNAFARIQYINEATLPTAAERIIAFTVNDGGAESNPACINLQMPAAPLAIEKNKLTKLGSLVRKGDPHSTE